MASSCFRGGCSRVWRCGTRRSCAGRAGRSVCRWEPGVVPTAPQAQRTTSGFRPSTAHLGASLAVQQLALRPSPSLVVRARRSNYRMLGSLLPETDQLLAGLAGRRLSAVLPVHRARQAGGDSQAGSERDRNSSLTGRCPTPPFPRVPSPKRNTCVPICWRCPFTRGCHRTTSLTWQALSALLPRLSSAMAPFR